MGKISPNLTKIIKLQETGLKGLTKIATEGEVCIQLHTWGSNSISRLKKISWDIDMEVR